MKQNILGNLDNNIRFENSTWNRTNGSVIFDEGDVENIDSFVKNA